MSTREKAVLKIGERVRVYETGGGSRIGTVSSLETTNKNESIAVKIEGCSLETTTYPHPKQCRRLRKKPGKPADPKRIELFLEDTMANTVFNRRLGLERAYISKTMRGDYLRVAEMREGEIILSQSEFEKLVGEFNDEIPIKNRLAEFLKKRLWP